MSKAMIETQQRTILEMLSYCRPAGSVSEQLFIDRYISPLGCLPDAFGNMILRVGTAPVLFSCHTDTVHRMDGRQKVTYKDGWASLPLSSKSNCLGADDCAGVFIMSEMIRAGVEGLYIFHREEEMGGFGSHHIASETPELLQGIRYAIAFDRKGQRDVIDHQFGQVCCSRTFGAALASAIGMGYGLADGTFTDTANYKGIIPECTNISVGYEHEHRIAERLDVLFLCALVERLKRIDWTGLPVERDPGLKVSRETVFCV